MLGNNTRSVTSTFTENAPESNQRWRIFCSRLRRRIRFLRHFQRILPRFFHARELRFMGNGAAYWPAS